jgi:hypothetical protein
VNLLFNMLLSIEHFMGLIKKIQAYITSLENGIRNACALEKYAYLNVQHSWFSPLMVTGVFCLATPILSLQSEPRIQ